MHPLNAMLRYRDLLVVEQLFRSHKALLVRPRPIFHQTDEAIRGHVFCSFLALVLRKELEETAGRRTAGSPSGVNCSPISTGYRKSRPSKDGKCFILRTRR